jgi:hypothetical protein
MAMSSSPGAFIETTCLSSRTLTLRYATPCTAGTSRSRPSPATCYYLLRRMAITRQ